MQTNRQVFYHCYSSFLDNAFDQTGFILSTYLSNSLFRESNNILWLSLNSRPQNQQNKKHKQEEDAFGCKCRGEMMAVFSHLSWLLAPLRIMWKAIPPRLLTKQQSCKNVMNIKYYKIGVVFTTMYHMEIQRTMVLKKHQKL